MALHEAVVVVDPTLAPSRAVSAVIVVARARVDQMTLATMTIAERIAREGTVLMNFVVGNNLFSYSKSLSKVEVKEYVLTRCGQSFQFLSCALSDPFHFRLMRNLQKIPSLTIECLVGPRSRAREESRPFAISSPAGRQSASATD